jgi:hypothetical protein
MSLDLVNDIVIAWANERVEVAQIALTKNKEIQNSRGSELGQSIAPKILLQTGNNLKIGIEANDYYDFVNKGVRGVGGSPLPKRQDSGVYSFKKATVGGKMVESIAQWIPLQAGLIISKPKKSVNNPRTSENTSPVSFSILLKGQKGQKGQKTMNPLPAKKRIPWAEKSKVEQNKIAAYGMAMSIKMRGLAYNGYWDEAFNDAEFDILVKKVEDALGGDINLTLTIE